MVKGVWHISHPENRNHGYIFAQMNIDNATPPHILTDTKKRVVVSTASSDRRVHSILACFSRSTPLACNSFDTLMFNSTLLINIGYKRRSIAIRSLHMARSCST